VRSVAPERNPTTQAAGHGLPAAPTPPVVYHHRRGARAPRARRAGSDAGPGASSRRGEALFVRSEEERAVRAGRSQGELPQARGADPRALAAGPRLRAEPRAPPGRSAVGLLRGPADRQRPARAPPRGGPHVQGRLPPFQDDDRPLRRAEGGVGLPRAPRRARGREGDRYPDQAGHRGLRGGRVQPPLPRVRDPLRRGLGATHGADRLLDRPLAGVLDDVHGVRRERLVVAQAPAPAGAPVPGRPDGGVLPAVRDRPLRPRGRPGLRDGGRPQRLRALPRGRGPRPGARRRLARGLDHDPLDAPLEPRPGGGPRAELRTGPGRGRRPRPRRGPRPSGPRGGGGGR